MDPFSAGIKLFEFIIKGLEMSSLRGKDFFREITRPAYERMQEIHISYVRMFRILDEMQGYKQRDVNLAIRDRFVAARKEHELDRNIFWQEMGKVMSIIEDADNRTFFGMIFLYFIYDEDYAAFFDKRWVDREIDDLRSRIAEESSRSDTERRFDTPSAKAAKEIAKLDNPEDIHGLAGEYINNLNRRMYSITERFVEIRQRYFPS